MTSPPKRDFTFAFFDAARTEGYVVPHAEADSEASGLGRVGGMFSDENEDENIVNKLRQLTANEMGSLEKATKRSVLARGKLGEHHADLFMGPKTGGSEQISKSRSEAQADSTQSIQLNRLLDDYMLGSKGDRIMEQMEELISDESAASGATSSGSAENRSALLASDLFGDEELDSSSDALTSMADFEKYIAEN